MSRVKTRTGVLVRKQGVEYSAYCNVEVTQGDRQVPCGWEAYRVRRSLGGAAKDGRRHDREVHGHQAVTR